MAFFLGIELAEVMAFGDNYNDVPMLDIVDTPYIMEGASAPQRESTRTIYPTRRMCCGSF